MESREFYRRTVKFGNSAGVLLPKSLLGAEVFVKVVSTPLNIKKDVLKILENVLEEIRGIYVLGIENKKVEIIAVSMNLSKIIDYKNYKINIVPLNYLKKMLKEKPEIKQRIFNSKTVMNKWLISDLKKEFGSSK